jgi:anaerobic selenocysteine-containing dehydrogenase
MGITQHKHSVDTIREIVNLHLMRGQIGKPGAGLCPVRGHSNVQGNRTMGINENPMPPSSIAWSAASRWASRTPGHNVYEALKPFMAARARCSSALGATWQPPRRIPSSPEAMRRSELNVQISTKLNRSHLMVSKMPDPPLPGPYRARSAALRGAEDHRGGHLQHGARLHRDERAGLAALSLRDRHRGRMAEATLGSDRVDWLALRDDYGLLRDLIEETIAGFGDFNRRIEEPCGFHLENSAALLRWNTASGRAEFRASRLPDSILPECTSHAEQMVDQPVLLLQSLRSHDQYNTTIYGMDDRYRGIKGRRNVVFMNEEDARRLGLAEEQRVDMSAVCNDGRERVVRGFSVIFYEIPKGNIAAYYPETNPWWPSRA